MGLYWKNKPGGGGRVDVLNVAVEGVALSMKLLGELKLVVVLQGGVGDNDKGDI